MSKNLFTNAIRDVKKSARYNTKNKKTIGKEFMEEIDFEKESMNLGEDLEVPPEDTNEKFKMNKLRSSLIDISKAKEPYSRNDSKVQYRRLITKKEDRIPNNQFAINIEKNSGNEINIPKRNKEISIKNSFDEELFTFNSSLKNKRIFACCYSKDKKAEKKNENINLVYSIFIRNLPMNPNEIFLRELFSRFGKILSFHIERDTAEIYYLKKESAIEAAKKFNHYEINGNKIKVTFYENVNENEKQKNSIFKNNENSKTIDIESIRQNKDPVINIVKNK